MNCERFERLLIDFMEDEIGTFESELVKKHLVVCPYCSKKLEEYKEIRRIFNEQTLPEPSPQVFARLSKIAREEVVKDKPPFWKKWFYSPILVPVFGSALALSVWVYYGQNNANVFSSHETKYSREAMAKKVPVAQEPNLSGVEKKVKSEKAPTLSNKLSPLFSQASRGKSGLKEAPPKPAPAEELISEKDVKESNKFSKDKEDSFVRFEVAKGIQKQSAQAGAESLGRLEEPGEQRVRGGKEKSEEAGLHTYFRTAYQKIDYQNQLDLALKQQKEGSCEASIKTNEGLLKSSLPPPDSIKEKAYLSLAECYEKREDWEKAVLNYENLQKVAPKQASFAKGRIQNLRQKATLPKQ